jgi:hypothetical protein
MRNGIIGQYHTAVYPEPACPVPEPDEGEPACPELVEGSKGRRAGYTPRRSGHRISPIIISDYNSFIIRTGFVTRISPPICESSAWMILLLFRTIVYRR